MRDIVLMAAIGWLMLQALKRPWIGILGWTWISIMNPHSLSWNLMNQPVAAAMGGATLVGIFTSSDKKQLFLCRENVALMVFMVWMCITLPFSIFFDWSYPLWVRVMKIDFMILVALTLLYTKRHINLLVWVLVISIGFYGVKGGAFTVLTGGSYKVWGPAGTYIEGNNEVALAVVMTIPLMRYLQMQMTQKWTKSIMTVCMILMAASALGSHSRGALLAIGAMALVLWWRGKRRLIGAVGMVIAAAALLSLMPAEWWDRMGTIKEYKDDTSAMGRINAWWMAFNLAKANFFGGGFQIWTGPVFAIYAPDPTDPHAAHSIYFQALGEHGFIGLFLFLLFFGYVFFSARRMRVQGLLLPETRWLSDLGSMIQVSLVGYAVGGAFLSLTYWDFPYNLMILTVAGYRWMDQKRWMTEAPEPVWILPAFLRRNGRSKGLA